MRRIETITIMPILAFILLSLLLTACSTAVIPPGGSPSLHAVHNERLHDLMMRMNSLLQEQIRTGLEVEQERGMHAREMAMAAGRLAGTVDSLITALPTLQLNADDRTIFLALADRLRGLAGQLERQAGHGAFDQARTTLNDIDRTCAACHGLFRASK